MTDSSVPSGDDAGTAEETASTAAAETIGGSPAATPVWLTASIAVVFGVFYAYDVWGAVDSFVQLSNRAAALGVTLSGLATAVLITALVLPLVVFGLALAIGRHRGTFVLLLLLIVGYSVVQALTSSLEMLLSFGTFDVS